MAAAKRRRVAARKAQATRTRNRTNAALGVSSGRRRGTGPGSSSG